MDLSQRSCVALGQNQAGCTSSVDLEQPPPLKSQNDTITVTPEEGSTRVQTSPEEQSYQAVVQVAGGWWHSVLLVESRHRKKGS